MRWLTFRRPEQAWRAPDAIRIAGPDEVLLVGWEHASAIPPDWELGAALRARSEGSELGLGAAAAQSLLDAYRELAETPDHTLKIQPRYFELGP